ncbi:ParB/RepB/Spo0J family partition protein [Deinococcus sp. MIMF12]|uniref:ParB/RepB/Spo0J family partition protein n=1 Tax=Deinococcus rhizophilus TaxID=3049544 RepID=A0ABT7JF83_9DEIO|nr:ParB/RepB/Spo0J family partition protein [Deinococcus rhizophilus]MDL2342593.1 ParB/RepB/Spo0J family partition protein [Deinococcus rhizophilus]
MTRALSPDVQAVLREATISEDGLTLTLAGDLDRKLYQATAKAIEALGGKWNRKAQAHLFTSDVRQILAGVLDGDKLPKRNPLAFFETPQSLVELMLSFLGDVCGVRVLEPSAGDGAIADALLDAGAEVDVIELDDTRHAHLVGAGYQPVARDFLQFTPNERYPVIVMNPPFTAEGDAQAYITHIEHAWTNCLTPGGTLVAIAPSGFTFRQDKRAQAFRALVEDHGEYAENDASAFVESGTGVQTVTLCVRKPAPAQEVAMPVPTEQPAKTTRKSSKQAEAPAAPPLKPGDDVRVRTGRKDLAVIADLKGDEAQLLYADGTRIWMPVTALEKAATWAQPEQASPPVEAASEPQPVTPILDGSSQSLFRVEQLVASPLNPRQFFDPAAVEELAESILHKGLMQNLVGRVAENGQDVEVVAGGRRLRALQLLAEQGRIPADYLVPVRVQPLSDLEALQLATAENVERRNMTPIEEADAFAQMVALGATPGDIALRFGYSAKTVQQRLVLAEGLGEDGRELFNSGQIGLEQAQVIAQTSGPLRKHVVAEAKRGVVASGLRSLIQRSTLLVQSAKFDVPASGLEVVEDLFGDEPARFADPQAAMALQMDWAKARAKSLEGKKEQYFVDLKLVNSTYLSPSHDEYRDYGAPKELRGTVIMLSTITGEVREIRTCRASDIKSHEAKQQAEQRKQAASEASGSDGGAIRKSGWVDGHEARATALRGALVGDHKRGVALTILSMLGAEPVSLHTHFQHVHTVPIPTGLQRLRDLDAKLNGLLRVPDTAEPKNPVGRTFGHNSEGEDAYQVLQALLTLTLEELLDLQSVLIAQAVGRWREYNPMHAPYAFLTCLAADVGAKVTFKLTDDHLKAYPRDRLLELAADANLPYIAQNVGNLSTNKDIRAAILQHADELHARGYVPPLARFPEVAGPDPADAQYRADALALLSRLSDRQVGDLLEDLGHDPTDQDTAADALALVRQEIGDMDAGELREWAALKRMAEELGPDATATAAD